MRSARRRATSRPATCSSAACRSTPRPPGCSARSWSRGESRHTRRFVAKRVASMQADLLEELRKFVAPLRENGATALFVFGSRARGTARPDSDLDMFIDYDASTKVPNIYRLMQ